jgi:hypothetical protein
MDVNKEGRLALASHARKNNQISSTREAARTYRVAKSTLQGRQNGRQSRQEAAAKRRLLLPHEEQELVTWIGSMQRRGFPPFLINVREMAYALRKRRLGKSAKPIGRCWVTRWLTSHKDVKTSLSRSRDYQRFKNENRHQIQPWFQQVKDVIDKYHIHVDDIYNFDETGFAMGLICTSSSSKVAVLADTVGRATVIQPGNRMWSTVIETINATGWALPPFVILQGKSQMKQWYKDLQTKKWKITVSPNGWTNDKIGVQFINHFHRWTKDRITGTYRLLLLDGHGSHATPDFEQFCRQNGIITLCLPPHTSHILQPLDVACFGPVKRAYSNHVQDLARKSIFHVDKKDFLGMYDKARESIHSGANIISGFRATGLVPFNPDHVLSQLAALTPSPPPSSHGLPHHSSPWVSQTPTNPQELAKQASLIYNSIDHSSPIELVSKVVNLCHVQDARITILEQEVAHLREANEYYSRKRKQSRGYLGTSGPLEVEEAQNLITQLEEAENRPRTTKRKPPTCSNCATVGHDIRTCQSNRVIS